MFFDQEKHYDKTEIPPSNMRIENMCKAKKTQSEIANAIGVSHRELSRNRVEDVYTHGRAFMRTYLRLLLKPKRYLIGENEADILETFLKKKWSPET